MKKCSKYLGSSEEGGIVILAYPSGDRPYHHVETAVDWCCIKCLIVCDDEVNVPFHVVPLTQRSAGISISM